MLASYHLCKMNVEVTLVEEDRTIGENPHCGGLVSADFWEKLGVPPKNEVVLNNLNALEIRLGLTKIRLQSKEPYALVLSRSFFDKYLYNLAKGVGTKFFLGARAERIRSDDQILKVRLADQSFLEDKVVVLAEGLSRLLTLQVGGKSSNKAIPSFQALVRGRNFDPRVAQIFLEGRNAPHYFAYFIPVSEDAGRLGVISSKADPSKVCEKMMRLLGFTQVKKYRRWGVWIHGPIRHPSTRGVILVGDAGGFTKPLTGGGMVWGGISARIAAKAISNSSPQDLLKNYISLSRRVFWLEAKAQVLCRGLLIDLLSPKALSLLFGDKTITCNVLGGVDYDFPFSKSPPLSAILGWKKNYLNNPC